MTAAEYDARVEQIAQIAMNPPKQTVGPFSYNPRPRQTTNTTGTPCRNAATPPPKPTD
jgi:hypothetical protein